MKREEYFRYNRAVLQRSPAKVGGLHGWAGALGATLAALFLSRCAGPAVPQYLVEKQTFEVRYVEGTPQIEVRATYRLKNDSGPELTSLEIALPPEQGEAGARSAVRVLVDGVQLTAAIRAGEPQAIAEVALPAPWQPKQRRSLVVEYALRTPASSGNLCPCFLLPAGAWYPSLLPPKGLLARGGTPPEKWELLLRVPKDYLVHASGRARGRKTRGIESEHRFEQRAADFDPFVVAGRYLEQRHEVQGARIALWSLQPLPQVHLQQAAPALAATLKTYEQAFGPLAGGSRAWVVEWPRGDTTTPVIPHVVTYSPDAFPGGFESPEFLRYFDAYLAATCFGGIVRADEPYLPARALPDYAKSIAGAARGGAEERSKIVVRALRAFDEAKSSGAEKPAVAVRTEDPEWLQRQAYAKSVLFFHALEDRFGREALWRALAHVVRARQGQSIGIPELRSALEQETRQDLSDFFRAWLYETGIPDDFRARYK